MATKPTDLIMNGRQAHFWSRVALCELTILLATVPPGAALLWSISSRMIRVETRMEAAQPAEINRRLVTLEAIHPGGTHQAGGAR
jgi:hypothetical protein